MTGPKPLPAGLCQQTDPKLSTIGETIAEQLQNSMDCTQSSLQVELSEIRS
jgi:hypothetical protein